MKKMSETRREAILAVAKAVFEELGFEHATMSEISTRMGGSKATLYRYFESSRASVSAGRGFRGAGPAGRRAGRGRHAAGLR